MWPNVHYQPTSSVALSRSEETPKSLAFQRAAADFAMGPTTIKSDMPLILRQNLETDLRRSVFLCPRRYGKAHHRVYDNTDCRSSVSTERRRHR